MNWTIFSFISTTNKINSIVNGGAAAAKSLFDQSCYLK
jgi:hypothetical protein